MDQPSRIGSYEIAGVLGEGAMGTVYIAHQQAPVQRTVALKVLKATDEPAEILDRYETERQAMHSVQLLAQASAPKEETIAP